MEIKSVKYCCVDEFSSEYTVIFRGIDKETFAFLCQDYSREVFEKSLYTNFDYVPECGLLLEVQYPDQSIHNIHLDFQFLYCPDNASRLDIYTCTLGANNDYVINDFLKFVSDKKKKCTNVELNCYTFKTMGGFMGRSSDGYWTSSKIRSRDISTIYLRDTDKKRLLDDINNFVSETTKKRYDELNVPYKRNYLFYGPPGTGKTSMATALTSLLGRDLYFIQFTRQWDNAMLESSLQNIKKGSDVVLFIEDIHHLFTKSEESKGESSVSFSALTTMLDGTTTPRGIITVMTTNTLDSVSKVILRPGRIDQIIKFDYMHPNEIGEMFRKFYPNHEQLCEKFLEKVDTNQLTPALLQNFFLLYLNNPEQLLDNFNVLDELKSSTQTDFMSIYN